MQKRAAKRNRGDWSSPKNEVRKRPMMTLTLAPEGAETLDRLAERFTVSRSVVVAACVLEQAEAIRSPAALSRLKERCEGLESPNGRRGKPTKK